MNTKNQIILRKIYQDISNNIKFGCDKKYLEIYLVKSSLEKITSYEDLLKIIFAYLHCTINIVFERINSRLKKDNFYLLAEDNRTLLQICDIIEDLRSNLRNTSLNFEFDKKYSSFLAEIRPFLQPTNGSFLPYTLKTIKISKYEPIFVLVSYAVNIENVEDFDNLIKKISLDKNANFFCLNTDEQLSLLNNVFENMLKEDNKFKTINTDKFSEIIDESTIKKFRSKTQCFRHASKDSLLEREKYSIQQKRFLVNFGLSVIDALLDKV